MHAIMLAGGGRSDTFAREHGVTNKALIPINGKPMFEYVYEAIAKSRHIQEIIVVGPQETWGKYQAPGVRVVVEDGGELTDNCLTGVRNLPQDGQRVALITSDIPMLTTEVLDNYLDIVSSLDGQLFYPLISREVNEAHYPGIQRTYAKLKGGTYTGGNVMVIDPAIAEAIAATVQKFVSQRKNVLAMGAMIGLPFLFRLITKQLTVEHAEKRMSEILKCKCVAIECPYAEIGTDVDKNSDLALARAALARS